MTALLSLGSNLGDRLANLRAALAALEAGIRLRNGTRGRAAAMVRPKLPQHGGGT